MAAAGRRARGGVAGRVGRGSGLQRRREAAIDGGGEGLSGSAVFMGRVGLGWVSIPSVC